MLLSALFVSLLYLQGKESSGNTVAKLAAMESAVPEQYRPIFRSIVGKLTQVRHLARQAPHAAQHGQQVRGTFPHLHISHGNLAPMGHQALKQQVMLQTASRMLCAESAVMSSCCCRQRKRCEGRRSRAAGRAAQTCPSVPHLSGACPSLLSALPAPGQPSKLMQQIC